MKDVLNHMISNGYYYLLVLFIIALIVLLIVTKPKKVKPIEITIDDVKDEKTDIEKVIESLEENKNSRPMTTFEEEQEANAIISYQELVEAVKQKRQLMGNLEPQVKEEPKEEVKKIEIEETMEEIEDKKETKKFKSSEFISPIFGKDGNKNNDDFLKELKDFRSNL